jgi:hypothetical protein
MNAILPNGVCPSAPRGSNMVTVHYDPGSFGNPTAIDYITGAMDYSPFGGVVGNGAALYAMTTRPTSPQRRQQGILSDDNLRVRIGDVRDGTSNTLILFEMAGRNDLYRRGQLIASPGTYGGGWADIGNAENWIAGSLLDGTGGRGPCAINCTNESGTGAYSFHSGGIHILLAEGSVRFLNENAWQGVFINLGTHQGGQITPDF